MEIKKKRLGDFKVIYPIFIVAFLLFLKGFYLLIQRIAPTGTKIITLLDLTIPFLSFFVVFYILYYPFLLMPLILYRNDKNNFFKTIGAMFLLTSCSFLIYSFFQTEIVRPTFIITNIFDQLVNYVYLLDKPLNLFPSLHVGLTTIAFLSLQKSYKKYSKYMLIIAVGIILSTVFIKQHYVLDVLAGLILAFVCHFIVYKQNKLREFLLKFRELTLFKYYKE